MGRKKKSTDNNKLKELVAEYSNFRNLLKYSDFSTQYIYYVYYILLFICTPPGGVLFFRGIFIKTP